MVEQDYYELLGIPRTADPDAVKAAYRKLAKEHHPDRHRGCTEQEARFKAINEAYDCLKDPQKRAAYDRFGKAAFQNGAGPDPFGNGGFESEFPLRVIGRMSSHRVSGTIGQGGRRLHISTGNGSITLRRGTAGDRG